MKFSMSKMNTRACAGSSCSAFCACSSSETNGHNYADTALAVSLFVVLSLIVAVLLSALVVRIILLAGIILLARIIIPYKMAYGDADIDRRRS